MYETEARKDKRGLWSDPQAIPPWEFRHSGKSNSSSYASTKSNNDIDYDQCKATTKKGTRCKRKATSTGYCWQHNK